MDSKVMEIMVSIEPEKCTHFEADNQTVTIIPFTGTVESEKFTGVIAPGGVDVQTTDAAGFKTLNARYVLTGKDFLGNNCHIYIENKAYFEPNSNPYPFHACPTFITDSPALKEYLGAPHFRAEGHGFPNGVKIIIFDTNLE